MQGEQKLYTELKNIDPPQKEMQIPNISLLFLQEIWPLQAEEEHI